MERIVLGAEVQVVTSFADLLQTCWAFEESLRNFVRFFFVPSKPSIQESDHQCGKHHLHTHTSPLESSCFYCI